MKSGLVGDTQYVIIWACGRTVLSTLGVMVVVRSEFAVEYTLIDDRFAKIRNL